MSSSYEVESLRLKNDLAKLTIAIISGLVVLLIAFLALWPHYAVFSKTMKGRAALAEAESSKMIAVQTAKAKYEAADYESRADVRRAQGVAQANKIISDSLGGPEGYLRWLYIEMLKDTADKPGGHQVIYLPTEAGLPILEAGKRPGHTPADQ